MTFEVRIDRHADHALGAFSVVVKGRLTARMAVPRTDPVRARPGADIKRLHDAPGLFRLRVGDYRIFYAVYPDQRVVVVTDVRHRSHAYD
ncbi:MAG: type II toxin-antitoxin system RelE family toxin [Thermoplasmatota archaeon]